MVLVLAACAFGLRAQPLSMPGVLPGGCLTCADGLISYWNFDETSGNAIDTVGSNDGTVNGATQGSTGIIGTGYSFDGANDFVDVGTMGDYGTNLDNIYFTASYWINTSATGIMATMGILNDGSTTFLSNQLNKNSNGDNVDGTLRGLRRDEDGNTWSDAYDSDAGITDGAWHHIVFIQGNNTTEIWVDGTNLSLTNASSDVSDNMANFGYGFYIGGQNNRGSNALDYTGNIDEVGIWNRQLTANEIALLYNAGAGRSYPFN